MYLLPSSQTARDPFQRLLFKQVLVFEPRSLYPDWHENWTVRPILKSLPSKRPLGISLGSGHLITKKTTQHIRHCLNALVWVWHTSRPSWRGKGDFSVQCLWKSSVWWNIVSFGISFLLGGKSRLFCAAIIKARYVTVRLLLDVYMRETPNEKVYLGERWPSRERPVHFRTLVLELLSWKPCAVCGSVKGDVVNEGRWCNREWVVLNQSHCARKMLALFQRANGGS